MKPVRRPIGPRRGLLHHVDADDSIDALVIDPAVSDVLVIVHHDGAVVGQSWLPGHRDTVPAAELRSVVAKHADAIRKRQVRTALARAVGRPPTDRPRRRSVSVIVCTRDRPDQLRTCLGSLLALRRPDVELLVVDNGSADDRSRQVCADLGVRVVVESRPGQTSARNCGVAATSGELVAFTDDDVIVDPRWLDEIDSEFDDPMTMIATGYIGPGVLDHESQVFFEAHGGFERRGDRVLFDPHQQPLLWGTTGAGAGANMVVRRQLFEEIGGFDEMFGAGTPTRASDDKVFYYRTLEAGFRIRYDPARIVWHQHRASHAALERIYRDYGTGEFTWAGHVLRTRRDMRAFSVFQWWLGHYVKDLARWKLGDVAGIPPRYTLAEIRGAIGAPRALRTVHGVRPAGGPRAGTGWSFASSDAHRHPTVAPGPNVEVVSEPTRATVAIASYNRRDSLARVLSLLDQQTVPSDLYDVIVVLDGCTDRSAELVRDVAVSYELRLVEQPTNRGLAVGRNVGAARAQHPIAVFLDDDIEPRPSWLAAHLAAHADRSADRWVMGYFPPVPGEGLLAQSTRAWWEDHFRRKAAAQHRWSMVDMVDGNSSVPLQLFRRMGGFDEAFTGGRRQDYEMGLRLIASNEQMAFARDAVADHRTVSTVASSVSNGFAEGRFDALILSKHPTVWNQLPIALAPSSRRDQLRMHAVERVGIDRVATAAARLERLGQQELWRKLYSTAWWGRYCAGFAAGAAEFNVGALPKLVRPRTVVELDGRDTPAFPLDIATLDLEIRSAGRTLGVVPALRPGGQQWDWDDLIERATDAALLADGASA